MGCGSIGVNRATPGAEHLIVWVQDIQNILGKGKCLPLGSIQTNYGVAVVGVVA